MAGIRDADEIEDCLELQDPQVRNHIRKSNEEYLAGKSRPFAEFLAELRTERELKKPKPHGVRRFDVVFFPRWCYCIASVP